MMVIDQAVGPDAVSLMDSFARGFMIGRPRTELIERNRLPFIERWHLARKNMVPLLVDPYAAEPHVGAVASVLENLYLHLYHRADQDEPHNHPWPNASLVLSGWYREDVYEDGRFVGRFERVPGQLVLREAAAVHAIVAVQEGTVSLFATMPKEQAWGFLVDGAIMPWREHKAMREGRVAATIDEVLGASAAACSSPSYPFARR